MKTSRQGFTLIEMLTVIAIIAILAALLFPAIKTAILRAEVAQAKADIKSLDTAIKQYFTEYGKLPLRDSLQGQPDSSCYFGVSSPEQYQVINTLRAVSSGDNLNNILNPRRIVFLETPSRKGALASSGTLAGSLVDPWSQVYYIKFDCDYDGLVDYYGNQKSQAIIISYGPNGQQSDPASANSDDLVNYK